jgi:hypothetical protein
VPLDFFSCVGGKQASDQSVRLVALVLVLVVVVAVVVAVVVFLR